MGHGRQSRGWKEILLGVRETESSSFLDCGVRIRELRNVDSHVATVRQGHAVQSSHQGRRLNFWKKPGLQLALHLNLMVKEPINTAFLPPPPPLHLLL